MSTPALFRRVRFGLAHDVDAVGSRSWVAAALRALALLALAGVLGAYAVSSMGCKPRPPVIVPSPPPDDPPVVDTFPELRLTTAGEHFVREAQPGHQVRKCVSCCKDTVGTGWPGLKIDWIRKVWLQGQCNLFHFRVGPFTSENESEWKDTGGGAYVEVDGRADLTQWNEPYWDALRAAAVEVGKLGGNLEVSILDGWSVKTQCWRSNSLPGQPCAWHPWHRAGNIQGQDHLSTAWKGTNPDAVQLAYVLKVYETVGDLQHVIFEDGTEPDQLNGDGGERVKWSLTLEALLRQQEAAHGWPAHLFGTNFVGDASLGWLERGRLQYQNNHKTQPIAAQAYWDPLPRRPLVFDEYNPEPPMKPEAVRAFACYCREYGCLWAAWRHDQTENQWLASLSLLSQDAEGCPAALKDGCPYDVAPVARVDCKVHGYPIHDCTPKNGSGGPILPEGDAARALCEQAAAGLAPWEGVGWSVSNVQGGTVTASPRANRWQFTLGGTPGATATLHCKLPNVLDACGGLRVTVR